MIPTAPRSSSRLAWRRVRRGLPKATIESRLDSAFFEEARLLQMDSDGIQWTVSVPFERFPGLKERVDNRLLWNGIDDRWAFFKCDWKPECWTQKFRVIVVRQKKKKPTKEPLQLDLFAPVSHEYDYQVMMTNKTVGCPAVISFHHGRGSQEGIFAEGKSHCQLEYVPVKSWFGNQAFCLAALFAHNLTRELQMEAAAREHRTTPKRRPLWSFETLGTLRRRVLLRAGRLIRPAGRLTLVISGTPAVRGALQKYLSPSKN